MNSDVTSSVWNVNTSVIQSLEGNTSYSCGDVMHRFTPSRWMRVKQNVKKFLKLLIINKPDRESRRHQEPACAPCGYVCAVRSVFGLPPCVLRELFKYRDRLARSRWIPYWSKLNLTRELLANWVKERVTWYWFFIHTSLSPHEVQTGNSATRPVLPPESVGKRSGSYLFVSFTISFPHRSLLFRTIIWNRISWCGRNGGEKACMKNKGEITENSLTQSSHLLSL